MFNFLKKIIQKILGKQQPYIKFTLTQQKTILIECFWNKFKNEEDQIEFVNLYGKMLYLIESAQLHNNINLATLTQNKKHGSTDISKCLDFIIQTFFNNASMQMMNNNKKRNIVLKPSEVFAIQPPNNSNHDKT